MGGLVSGVTGWPFMQEPAWRWFVFVGMLLLFLMVWGGVIRHL